MSNVRHLLYLSLACYSVTLIGIQQEEVPALLSTEKEVEDDKGPKAPFDETIYNWSRTFAEVLQITNQKHYHVDDAEKCMIKAIDSFLGRLDPHSSFLDPKTYKAILESTSGEFFGIGIIIDNTRQPKDKFLLVVDTIPNGPADNAGIKPLDKIIEVDGEPLEGMSTDEATAKLRGERNTKVHIKILREGQQDLLPFDITRDVIKEQSSACFYLPDQNVYYISLTTFSENSIKQIAALLEKTKHKNNKENYKALILDLRNNTGGLLPSVVDIAGLFLRKGSLVVVTKNKSGEVTDRYVTTRNPITNTELPIFIMTNNYTASAAEILAGCLKAHSEQLSKEAGNKTQKELMVFIVGSRSFGKGSVQEVIPVTNNCAAKITTSLYFLLNDMVIQGSGITPDFVVERQFPPTEQVVWFTKFYGREGALGNFIKPAGYVADENDEEASHERGSSKKKDKKLKGKAKKDAAKDKEKNWTERTKDVLAKDNQFRATLTLINILALAQKTCPEQVTTRQKAVSFINGIYPTSKELSFVEVKI